jgi:hypothetical protein
MRRLLPLLLLLLVVVAIAILIAPMRLLHPFKEETARGLAIAFAVKRWGVLVNIAAALAAIVIAAKLWGGRWWRKAMLVVAVLLTVAAAALAPINVFERMFRPLLLPQYAAAGDAKFVDADDMVMAVTQGAEAAAYPIRQLAYHHVVMDVVGGIPIVVTY